jgi:hypothetical protein
VFTYHLKVLRDDRRRLEERLDAEKRDKNQIELKLSQAQADMHAKVREAQEAAEVKLREAVRRAKAEVLASYMHMRHNGLTF